MAKISDSKRDEIVNKLQQDIDAANAYYKEEIEPRCIERYDVYNATEAYYRKKFPRLSKRSDVVSTDVQDVIESTMPALMKTFFGSTDTLTVQGQDGGDKDDRRAKVMQELVNFQLEKNRFYMTFYQWAKDALIVNAGIIKADWQREYEDTEQTQTMNSSSYEQFAEQAKKNDIKIESVQALPTNDGFLVTYIAPSLTVNQPRIRNLLASEFRFSPDAITLEDAEFVAHRKIVSLDYLRKQEKNGMYDHVEELSQKATKPEYTTLDIKNNKDIDKEINTSDTGRKKVELYECYVNINMEDDENGELTPMIITVSNGVILRMEENTYGRNPFFILSARTDPHKIWPETGFVDLIAQIQHCKTAIMRQMIYNIAQGNDTKMAVDISKVVDINDITDGRLITRIKGNTPISQAIQPIPASPLQSWTFDMLEYLDTVKENRTGVTKYNQGLDSNSLNKTATGISIITQQSNQRLELIARMFAETGMYELFRYLIKMNQLFINEQTVIRLTNEEMVIDPTDLEGDFDLIVNAGMGAGAKQTNLQNLQLLEQVVEKLSSIGMAGTDQIYNLAKRIIEEIGYKNVDDFIIPPDKLQQQPQQPQQPPISENMRINLDNAPWQIKQQYYEQLGFKCTPDMFTEQGLTDIAKAGLTDKIKVDSQTHAKAQQANIDNQNKQLEAMINERKARITMAQAGAGGQASLQRLADNQATTGQYKDGSIVPVRTVQAATNRGMGMQSTPSGMPTN